MQRSCLVLLLFASAVAAADVAASLADEQELDCGACGDDVAAEASTSLLQRTMQHRRSRVGEEAEEDEAIAGRDGRDPESMIFTQSGSDSAAHSAAERCRGLACLEQYVATPDAAYTWADTGLAIGGTADGISWKGHILNMTSQRWLSTSVLARTEWLHTMVVVVPEGVSESSLAFATVYTAFGNYGQPEGPAIENLLEASPDVEAAALIATRTHSPVAVLYNVPPALRSVADGTSRAEDDLMTWGQLRFFRSNGSDTSSLVELPMTKAVVRAMDTVSAFLGDNARGKISNRRFAIMGTSKRGVLSWHVAAVDKRVEAIVPLSRPLNLKAFMRRAPRCFDGMPYVALPYVQPALLSAETEELNTAMWAITDPIRYPQRFVGLQKFVIDAAQDQYFMPDSTAFWWSHMPGPSLYLMLPNEEHLIGGAQVLGLAPAIANFLEGIVRSTRPPELSWTLDARTGRILAELRHRAAVPAVRATLWQARTCGGSPRRDFRKTNRDVGEACTKCGVELPEPGPTGPTCQNNAVQWSGSPLPPKGAAGLVWEAAVPIPQDGTWVASFIGFEIDVPPLQGTTGSPRTHRLSTEVLVVPELFPFPDPGSDPHQANSTLVLAERS